MKTWQEIAVLYRDASGCFATAHASRVKRGSPEYLALVDNGERLFRLADYHYDKRKDSWFAIELGSRGWRALGVLLLVWSYCALMMLAGHVLHRCFDVPLLVTYACLMVFTVVFAAERLDL